MYCGNQSTNNKVLHFLTRKPFTVFHTMFCPKLEVHMICHHRLDNFSWILLPIFFVFSSTWMRISTMSVSLGRMTAYRVADRQEASVSAASVSVTQCPSLLMTHQNDSAENTASATTTAVITLRTCSVAVCAFFCVVRFITTRCTIVQNAVLHVVCPSVYLWRWWIMTT